MRAIALLPLIISCTLPAHRARAEAPLLDLLFFASTGFGGFGRLVHSSDGNRYHLLDGRLHTYVVDGQVIRPMRAGESSGTLGNPSKVVALDGKLFGNSAYAQIHELDPVSGAVLNMLSFGAFSFGGGGSPIALHASDKALLIMHGSTLTSLDSSLKKVGEKKLADRPRHERLSPSFVQSGSKLFDVEIDNPNAYTDCAGPRGCGLKTVIRQTTVDFANPGELKLESREEPVQEQPLLSLKGVDAAGGGWLVATAATGTGETTLIWLSFERLSSFAARLKLAPGARVEAMTPTGSPFWLVLSSPEGKKGESPRLARIERRNGALTLATYALSWLKGSYFRFSLAQDSAGRLYVASNHQLAVYDTNGPEPRLLLQQDFVDATNGSAQFQLEALTPVQLAKPRLAVDRARLEDSLNKDSWSEIDQLAIQAEIEKLTASDRWAIPLFTKLLGDRSRSYRGGIKYSAMALEKFGSAAASAVPALVYSTMEGASIRGDALPVVAEALKKIDPRGVATRAMLPECIKKTYVCEHVGKKILAGLGGH